LDRNLKEDELMAPLEQQTFNRQSSSPTGAFDPHELESL
jgi:hypothetical protein